MSLKAWLTSLVGTNLSSHERLRRSRRQQLTQRLAHKNRLSESLEDRTLLSSVGDLVFQDEIAPGAVILRSAIPVEQAGRTADTSPTAFGSGSAPSQLNGQGLQFNLIPSGTMSQQSIDGFIEAANLWSQIFTDDIIVNINIDFRDLGAGILGQASSSTQSVAYSAFRTSLAADATSSSDELAVGNLPVGPNLSLYTSAPSSGAAVIDNNNTANNSTLNANTTVAKALGIRSADDSAIDASIAFSSNPSFTWDFDRSNGITGGAFDFVGVAAHEIGHALGFRSGADVVDQTVAGGTNLDNFRVVTQLDVFRQSTASVAAGADIDLRADTDTKFFSLDAGTTSITTYSTGRARGDGNQASHWKDNQNIGIMDPTAAPAEYADITDFDVQAFDVFGWDVRHDYGDAPDTSAGTGAGDYQTSLHNNGPRHELFAEGGQNVNDQFGNPKVFLGSAVDREFIAQASGDASGDGADDDGIGSFPELRSGETTSLSVTSTANGAILNYFFDFNANGVFDDAGESFTAVLNSSPQSIPVVIPETAVIGTSKARFRISTAGGLGPNGPAHDGEVEDYEIQLQDGAPGVNIVETGSATLLSEDGLTDTYEVSLNSNPTGTVRVEISADSDTQVSLDGSTFTASVVVDLTDRSHITVTVRAIDDALLEGAHTGTVSHAVIGPVADTDYPISMTIDPLVANITDNEILPDLIGIDLGGGTTPVNWTPFPGTTDVLFDDLIDESGTVTSVDLDIDFETTIEGGIEDFAPPAAQLPIHDQSLAGLDRSFTDSGSVVFTFSELTPFQAYEIYVFAGDIAASNQKVTITGATTETFNQPHNANQLIINDQVGDSSLPLSSYARMIAADASGQLIIDVDNTPAGNPATDFLGLAGIAIRPRPVLPPVYINEFVANPAGADNPNEYVELRGLPGQGLEDFYLVFVEGDAESSPGTIRAGASHVINLAGSEIGTNGFLIVADAASNPYSMAPGTSVLDVPGLDFSDTSYTAFLVHVDSVTGAAPTAGQDLDTGDDGLDPLPTGWTIADGVSALDGGATDRAYASIVFSSDGAGQVESGATLVNAGFGTGDHISHLMRIGNSTGSDIASWAAFELTGTAPDYLVNQSSNTDYEPGSLITYHLGEVNPTFADGPAVELSVDRTSGSEDDETVFTITATSPFPVAGDQTVTLNISGPGITAGDYVLSDSVITIPGGTTSGFVTLTVFDDALVEDLETATLSISNPSSRIVLGAVTSADISITDNDFAVFTIQNVEVVESAGTMTLTVALSAPVDRVINVDVAYSDVTATGGGTDYDSATDTATFPAGSTASQTVTVAINDDNLVELVETFTAALNISTAIGARDLTVGASATGTITDNDAAAFTINDVTVNESTGVLRFTITPSNPVDTDVSVDVAFSDVSAVGGAGGTGAGIDYGNDSVTVTFPANNGTARTVAVAINDDDLVELTETFGATISLNAATVLGTRNVSVSDSGVGTITDDDIAVFTVENVAVDEDAGTMTLSVSLSKPLEVPADIIVSYTDVSATGGNVDYDSGSDTVSFAANSTTPQTVTVAIVDDNVSEPTETFDVALALSAATPVGARAIDVTDTAVGTITDDDVAVFTIENAAANEDDGTMTFTVSLSRPLDVAVDIDVSFSDITALGSGTDYDSSTRTVTFPANSTANQTLTVALTDDDIVEQVERFLASLSVNAASPVGDRQIDVSDTGVGSIRDNDTAVFTIEDVTVNEDDGTLTFDVALSNVIDIPLNIDVAYTDVTATGSGTDYDSVTDTISFPANDNTTRTVTVAITDDTFAEYAETFTASLAVNAGTPRGGRAVNVTDTATGTILDDDTPTFKVDDVTANEADGTMSFVVSLSHPLDIPVNVDVTYTGVTATGGGTDFDSATDTVTFPAGSVVSQTVTVAINDDDIVELAETFNVGLSINPTTPIGGRIINITDTAVGTITDNDAAVFTIEDVTAAEDVGNLVFMLSLSRPVDIPLTVDVNYSNITAAGGNVDYDSTTDTIVYPANSTTPVPVLVAINDDSIVELTELFRATLSPGFGGGIGTRLVTASDAAIGTITDNDNSTLTITSVTELEGTGGTTTDFEFIVRLGDAVQSTFDLAYTTSDDTATLADGDYIDNDGSLSFAGTAGEERIITVQVNHDGKVELNEAFTVLLGGLTGINPALAANINVQPTAAVGTITNDDSATLVISDVQQNEGSTGGTTAFTFVVTLSHDVDVPVSIDYSVADGTATAASGDFGGTLSGTLNFDGNAGETETLAVLVNADTTVELSEQFSVNLAALPTAVGRIVSVADGTGVGNITNDDSAVISIADISLTEGDSGITNFVFTAVLSHAVDVEATIEYSTIDGTAMTADSDYLASNGNITFGALTTGSQTFAVQVVGDEKVELDETFAAQLSNLSVNGRNVTFENSAVATILDDDAASLTIDSITRDEGSGGTTTDFLFTVTLNKAVQGGFDVAYSTIDGTATRANGDFAANDGVLSFAGNDGETHTITVVVNHDDTVEADETFRVLLGALTNLDPIIRDQITLPTTGGNGVITNDDEATLSIDDVTILEGDSGTATAIFTVTLNNTVNRSIAVDYSVIDGTATAADNDFVGTTAGTLTFVGNAGETQTLAVPVLGDRKSELDETFDVVLSNLIAGGRNVAIDNTGGTGTITDDDTATLSIANVTRNEGTLGTTVYTFTVTLDKAVDDAVTVDYETVDDSATLADSDYISANGTLNFNGTAGETRTLSVQVLGDRKVELDEQFMVRLLNASANGRAVNASATAAIATITNDDRGNVTIDDVTVTEGDSGNVAATFTVTLDKTVDTDVTISYSAAGGTATVTDGDFGAASGTVSFAAGSPAGATQTLAVQVAGDEKVELTESFSLNLTGRDASGRNVVITDNAGLGIITNDDSASLSIDSVARDEGNSGTQSFVFTVTLNEDVDAGVSVGYSVGDNTATRADNDYALVTPGTLSFVGQKGETQTIGVTVNSDTKVELDETFNVNLASVAAGGRDVTIATAQGTGTIQNDDEATITIADAFIAEGNSGTRDLVFTLTLDADVDAGLTLEYSTADGTALTADDDYVSSSGNSVTFGGNAGETQTFAITVNGDAKVELDESFLVNLSGLGSSGRNVTIPDSQAVGTIANDDVARIRINDQSVQEGNGGTSNLTFTATLSAEVAIDVTIDFTTTAGTASAADGDYPVTSNTVRFDADHGPGDQTVAISVPVNGDTKVELNESFFVDLLNLKNSGLNVSFADTRGVATILNDDNATVSVMGATVTEGTGGNSQLDFIVSLSAEVDSLVGVQYATRNDTAASTDNDFTFTSGTLNFAANAGAGVQTVAVSVPVIGDSKVELNESFFLDLQTLSPAGRNVTFSGTEATGTINNDDSTTIIIQDVTAAEGHAGLPEFHFEVTLLNPVDAPVDVDYATQADTASPSDGDYQSRTGTLNFAPNVSANQVLTVVVPVGGDRKVEMDEVFSVLLSNLRSTGRDVSIADATGVGTILNDDSATVSVQSISVSEGDSGTSTIEVSIVLDAEVDAPVSVDFASADDTATVADGDYTGIGGRVDFAVNNGAAPQIVRVPVQIHGDRMIEPDERFLVSLAGLATSGLDVTLDVTPAAVVLLNDDLGQLDVDENNSANAATDGVLALRYLFGFQGQPLIDGAVGASAGNPTAAGIEAVLDGSHVMLDVDGNGTRDAATDGILLLRYLFGFRDDALVSGVIGAGATRTTGPEVAAFLDSFHPQPPSSSSSSSTAGGGTDSGDATQPSTPAGVSVTLTADDAQTPPSIAWTPVSGADSYLVRIARLNEDQSEAATVLTTLATDTSFSPSSTLSAGSYRVWIQAISASAPEDLLALGFSNFAVAFSDETNGNPVELVTIDDDRNIVDVTGEEVETARQSTESHSDYAAVDPATDKFDEGNNPPAEAGPVTSKTLPRRGGSPSDGVTALLTDRMMEEWMTAGMWLDTVR